MLSISDDSWRVAMLPGRIDFVFDLVMHVLQCVWWQEVDINTGLF